MRDAIHALKYAGLRPAARRLGELLAHAISQLAAEVPGEMLLVPVPLHRSKYAERGFNQARALTTHALAAVRRKHPAWRLALAPHVVVRDRATQRQAGLTPRQRRQNVRGAFVVVDPEAVAGQCVLVVDDIFTTGATARAMSRVLLDAGAAKVWVATLARAGRVYMHHSAVKGVYSERETESREVRTRQAELGPAAAQNCDGIRPSPLQPCF